VDFRVLGPVEVVAEETRGVPGGAIPRAILALLLVAGAPVGRDRLIDELWGMDPPKTAVNALHVHLSALRRLCGDRLRTTPAGYLLEPTADDSIDLVDFESALRAGTLHGLRSAVAMWRGSPFSCARPTPSLEAEAIRLTGLHADALHRLGLAALEAGEEAEAVAELASAVVLYPTDEYLTYQRPFDGRNTTSSVLPSPSPSRRAADVFLWGGNGVPGACTTLKVPLSIAPTTAPLSSLNVAWILALAATASGTSQVKLP